MIFRFNVQHCLFECSQLFYIYVCLLQTQICCKVELHVNINIFHFISLLSWIHISLKSDKNNGYFPRWPIYNVIISRSVLLRLRCVLDKSCRENQKQMLCSITVLLWNRAVYEIMWENIVVPERSQMTMWSTHIACWIPEITNTNS